MRSAALAVAVVVTQVVFLAITAFGTPCPERCPEDGSDGRCLPLCGLLALPTIYVLVRGGRLGRRLGGVM